MRVRRCIGALKKRRRVLKKRGSVLKKVCLVRGTGGGRLLQKGGGLLKKGGGWLSSVEVLQEFDPVPPTLSVSQTEMFIIYKELCHLDPALGPFLHNLEHCSEEYSHIFS